MTSCTSYLVQYQVYTVKSDLKQGNGSLKYENEDCILHYNLWAEGGNPGFVMENKADIITLVICIVLPRYNFRRATEQKGKTKNRNCIYLHWAKSQKIPCPQKLPRIKQV